MNVPPFGEQFQPVPPSGVRVAIGPDAWAYQKSQGVPVITLPLDREASNYDWPISPDSCALIVETGPPDDGSLDSMAAALIQSGHRFVIAVRQSQIGIKVEPYIYYEAEYV